MTETINHTERREIPFTICPDCVRQGLVADPRSINKDAYVIESVCRIHRMVSKTPDTETKTE